MIQKEKDLRAKLESLKAEKSERLRLYKNLNLQDQHLCDVLQMTPYYVPSGTVPTMEQLNELEKHIAARNAEKVCIYFSKDTIFVVIIFPLLTSTFIFNAHFSNLFFAVEINVFW